MDELFYKCLTLKGIIREASRRAQMLVEDYKAKIDDGEEEHAIYDGANRMVSSLDDALEALAEIENTAKNGDRNSI